MAVSPRWGTLCFAAAFSERGTARAGYKVIFVPFENGRPSGLPEDVLTGFIQDGDARGRPVGVAVGKGALLVADDVGNTIWRVTGSIPPTADLR